MDNEAAIDVPAPARLRGATMLARVARAMTIPLALVVLWHVIAENANPLLFATPWEVVVNTYHLLATDEFWYGTRITLARAFQGLAIASCVAIPLAIAIGRSRVVAAMFEPVLVATYPVVRLALYPVFILIFGFSGGAEIALVAMECSYPLALNTIAGVRGIDRDLLRTARNSEAGRLRLMFGVIVRSALPAIFAGYRIALPSMLIVIVVIEMIAGGAGLGWMITDAASRFEPKNVLSIVLFLAALGYTFDRTLALLRRRVVFWEGRVEL